MRVGQSEKDVQGYVERYGMADFLNPTLLGALHVFHFPIHSYVYHAGQEQTYFYLLVEGQVQCSHYHASGKLAVLALCDPFTAIGDLEILDQTYVNSDVIATKPTTMLGLARTEVQFYGANDPRFLRFLLDQIKGKLYKANTIQITHLLPVINRLALYLLAQPQAERGVALPDKEQFALMLGTTTRHLNRVLKELVEQAIISVGYPQVRILDRAALERLSL